MGIERSVGVALAGLGLAVAGNVALAQSKPADNRFGVPAGTTAQPQSVSEDGVTPIGTGQETPKQGRTFTNEFGLSVGVTVSDNIDRAFGQNAQAGYFLTISPSYTGKLQTRRSWADISFGLDYETVFPIDDGQQQRADAVGGRFDLGADLSLLGDALRVAASANVNRASDLLSGTGASGDASNLFLDEDSTSYQISPYSRGEWGSSNQYDLRWQSRFLDPSGNVPHSVRHQLIGDVGTSPLASATIGWNARVAAGSTRIDNGTSFEQLLSELTFNALLTDGFRFGLGVNYVQVGGVRDSSGKDSGVGPSVFMEWRPARATRFRARLARAYLGNLIDASLTRASTNWAMRVAYREGFEERNALASIAALDLRNAFSIDRADFFSNNTVVRGLQARGVPLSSGTDLEGSLVAQIQSPVVFDKTLTFSSGYLWPRAEVLASLYASQINGAIVQPGVGYERINRFGVSLTYGYALGRRNKIRLRGSHRTTDLNGLANRTDESNLSLAWELKLSRRIKATFAYRHSREYNELADSQLRENAVYGLFNYRF